MIETLVSVLAIVSTIVGAFYLIYLMERRSRTKGPLFTGPASPAIRILALLLGIGFAVLSLSGSDPLWLILSIALIGYSLGMDGLLKKLQEGRSNTQPYDREAADYGLQDADHTKAKRDTSTSRFLPILGRWTVLLIASGSAIYGAIWILAHPNKAGAILIGLVVAFAVLGVVFYVFGVLELMNVIKRLMK